MTIWVTLISLMRNYDEAASNFEQGLKFDEPAG